MSRPRTRGGWALFASLMVAMLTLDQPKSMGQVYTDFVWTASGLNAQTAASWTNNVVPKTNDPSFAMNWIITNTVNVANNASFNTDYQVNNFTAYNLGTAIRTIWLQSNTTFQAHGTTIIGSNIVLTIGRGSSTYGNTFSNNNLYLQDNAEIRFNNNANSSIKPFTLIAAGNFTNSTQSLISAGGAGTLRFDTTSFAITNAGTIRIVTSTGYAGSPFFDIVVGNSSNFFLHNSGTMLLGFAGGANAQQRLFVISNQFVNTSSGFFVVTNRNQGSGGSTTYPMITFIGSSRTTGGASTNLGTIRMATDTDGIRVIAPAGTLTFANGDFVNLGTVTFNSVSNGVTSGFIVAETGAVFSNALGGQVIMETTGSGNFAIKADTLVNLGTNLLGAGTLQYTSGTGGAGTLQNAGTILFGGGFLDVTTLTNTASGVITNTIGAGNSFIWKSGSTLFNAGTIAAADGTLTNLGTIVLANGGRVGGTVSNAGTIFLTNGTTTLAGTILNNGVFNLTTNAALSGTSIAMTNLSGGTINAVEGLNLNLTAGPLMNYGVINVTNGWVNFQSGLSNAAGATINLRDTGTLVVNGTSGILTNAGTLIPVIGGAFISNSVVNLSGGFVKVTSNTFTVFGDVINAGQIDIGKSSTAAGTTILTNNNFYLTGSGVVNFFSGTTPSGLIETWLVGGVFTNTSQSIVQNTGSATVNIRFLGDSQTVVTNQGLFNFSQNGGAPVPTIQVGSDAAQGTFFNMGTFQVNIGGAFNGKTTATVLSNSFVNAGMFMMSNTTSSATTTWQLQITKDVTNQANSTFKIFAGGNLGNTLTLTTGNFINSGTNVLSTVAGVLNQFMLPAAGAVFSNAAGSVMLVNPDGTSGTNRVGVGTAAGGSIVNLGMISIGGGTLELRAATPTTRGLQNAGTIEFTGGNLLAADGITNAGGTIRLISGNGTLVSAVGNSGTLSATGGALVLAAGLFGNTNAGLMVMGAGGTIQVGTSAGIMNNAAGRTNRFLGGTLVANAITNLGVFELAAGNSGTIASNAATASPRFVNQGLISLASGQTLTFAGVSVTNGASGSFFANGGSLVMSNASFFNSSITPGNWSFEGTSTMLFTNTGGTFFLTANSLDTFGQSPSGTNNNFFIANLTLAGAGTLQLTNAAANRTAIYVNNITVDSVSTLNLNGATIYYAGSVNTNGATILNGSILPLLGAQDLSFIMSGASFDWSTAGNWSPALVPNASDTARLTNATAATVTYLTNYTTTISSLILSNNGGVPHTLFLSNSTLKAGSVLVGDNGILQIGGGTAAAVSSNTTLTLTSGGKIVLSNGTTSALNQLFVVDTLTRSAGSSVTLDGAPGATNVLDLSTVIGLTTNNGPLTAQGGVNVFKVANLNNQATILVTNAATLALQGAYFVNAASGLITNTGGTLSVAGLGASAMVMTNAGTLAGNGALIIGPLSGSTGAVVNTGAISASQIVVGQTGRGTLTLNSGNIYVNQLLVTNNTATSTNSFFTFSGGTLTTSNAAGAYASQVVIPAGAASTFVINGTWNMLGGSNLVTSASGPGNGYVYVGNGANSATINVVNAVWNMNSLGTASDPLVLGAGAASNNVLNILEGSTVVGQYSTIGASAGSVSNTVLVSGAGSVWSNTRPNYTFTIVGDYGQGNQLIVSNGGKVYVQHSLWVGYRGNSNSIVIGSNATVQVMGGDSVYNRPGMFVGGTGSFNSLIVTNGGFLYTFDRVRIGAYDGAVSNRVIVTGSGSVFSNTQGLLIGELSTDGAGTGNTVVVENGGVLISGGIQIGSSNAQQPIKSTGNSLILTNGGKITAAGITMTGFDGLFKVDGGPLPASSTLVTNTAISMVAVGNRIIVTNAMLYTSGNVTVGSIASPGNTLSNSIEILADATWNLNGASSVLTIGNDRGTGHVVLVNGGVFSNVGAVQIGFTGAMGNRLVVTNGGRFFSQAVTVGAGSTGSNNAYIVGGSGAASVASNGLITIGSASGGNNALQLTNASLQSTGLFIGNGSSNNTVTVNEGATWDLTSGQLTFGAGTGNVLRVVDSVTLANVGGLGLLGENMTGLITNNMLMVGGNGITTARVTLAGGSITLGSAGFGGNTLTISNQLYTSTGPNRIGDGSSDNTLLVLPDTVWNLSGGQLNVGYGVASAGNLVLIDGAVVTGSVLYVGGSSGWGNTLIVSNGGLLGGIDAYIGSGAGASNNLLQLGGYGAVSTGSFSGILRIGSADNFNSLVITNAALFSSTGSLGSSAGANYNTATILTNGSWTLTSALNVGSFGTTGNTLTVNGGLVTPNAVIIGNTLGASFNSMTLTNGGRMLDQASFVLGNSVGANSNSLIVVDNSLLSMAQQAFRIGNGNNTTGNWVLVDGSVITNIGQSSVYGNGLSVGGSAGSGSNAFGNSLLIVNGGKVFMNAGAPVRIGNLSGANANSITISNGGQFLGVGNVYVGDTNAFGNAYNVGGFGAVSVVSNGSITVGTLSSNNTLTVTNATLVSGTTTIGNGSSNNTMTVWSGGLWNLQGSNLTVGAGAATGNVLRLEGTAIVTNVGTLRLTNNLNQVRFNGGALSVANAFVSNQVFTVGDGTQRATYQSLVGTQTFAGGLLIMSNAVLKGTGTIRGTTILTNGATIAPGNSPGTLNVGDLVWYGGGIYSNDLVDFASAPGTGWDYINGAGSLVFTDSPPNYVIRLDSGGAPAANFVTNQDYSLAIAGFVNGFTNFVASKFTVDTSALANPFGGTFAVTIGGTNLYLTYSGVNLTPNFVWTNGVSDGWNNANAWTNLVAPPNNGNDTQVLRFDAGLTDAYAANNNITPSGVYTNNKIVLNSISASTNTLSGSMLTFAGSQAGLYQQASGAFIISNSIWLTGATVFRGPGLGAVILASNITGNGQITKQGSWNLTLQGSNTFAGPVLVNGGTVTLAHQSAFGTNSITISNGTVNASALATNLLGYGVSNVSLRITGSGSKWTGNILSVGWISSSASNSIIVENGGTLSTTDFYLRGSSSSLLLTNGATFLSGGGGLRIGGADDVPSSSFSNTFTVVGGPATSTWNGGNNNFIMGGTGNGVTSFHHVVTIGAGGVATNVANTFVGHLNAGAAPSYGNQLVVRDGGKFLSSGSITVGNLGTSAGKANSNLLLIAGGYVSVMSVSAMSDSTGTGGSGEFNGVIITNGGQLFTSATNTIGAVRNAGVVALSNYVQVLGASSLWNLGGSVLYIGTNRNAYGNSLLINAGLVTNMGALTVGLGGGTANSLTITNGGRLWSTGAVTIGLAASNNAAVVTGSGALWNLGGAGMSIGVTNSAGNSLRIDSGATMANVGSINVGTVSGVAGVATGNSLIITNGGQLVMSSSPNNSYIGNRGSNNFAVVSGANSLWNLRGSTLNVGYNSAGVSNQLWITAGGLVTNGNISLGQNAAGASSNTLIISDGSYAAEVGTLLVGDAASASLSNLVVINAGSFVSILSNVVVGAGNREIINGGLVQIGYLTVSNGVGTNTLTFNGGTLATFGTVISNNANFVIGNGSSNASFYLVGGNHYFQQGLVATNQGVLAGGGNAIVGAGNAITIQSGGAINPSYGPGYDPVTLTNTGTLIFESNGRYQWEFNSTTGNGWDLIHVIGSLSNAATSLNPFIVDVRSWTAGNVPGLVPDFDKDGNYTFTIATTTGGLGAFDASKYGFDLSSFSNAWDGVWSVLQSGNNLQLNYAGADGFTWDNVNGNFSNLTGLAGTHWLGDVPPPLNTTNLVMYFGGIGANSYTATNNLTGVVTKRIVLTNNATASQTITGNAISLAGLRPEILQNGGSGFVFANELALGTNALFGGSGSGSLTVAGEISGAYGLTKTGSYTLVLSGSNTYSGATIISNGQVRADSAYALASTTVSNLVTGGVAFGVANPVLGGLAGDGDFDLTNTTGNAVSLSVGYHNGNATYTGNLGGSGSLTKVGSGTQTLTANSTYTGDTLVSAGTLTVSGQLASTNLWVTGGNFNWAGTAALPSTAFLIVSNAGNIYFNANGTVAGLGGNGNLIVASGVTASVGGASSTFAGDLTGLGTLAKVSSGTLTLTGNANAIQNLAVTGGTLALNGATAQLIVTNLTVTGGGFALNSGTLTIRGAGAVSNGQNFVVGDGANAATLNLLGTLHTQTGLVVTNKGIWTGTGTVIGGTVRLVSGSTVSPADAATVGTLNVTGTTLLGAGGRYLFNVSNYAGSVADLLAVTGVLSNGANNLNPFVVDIWSLPGAGFDPDANYTLTLATGSSVANYALNAFSVVTSNLNSSYDGTFKVLQSGNNLVLSYTGGVDFVWNNPNNGTFNTAANWVGGSVPPTDQTNTILTFRNASGQSYVADNNLGDITTKKLVLTNASLISNPVLTGNGFVMAGAAPRVMQEGAGIMVISNAMTLAANTLFSGAGNGTLFAAGDITGSGRLTKTGTYALVLGGSNTYSGLTVVQAGQLVIANRDALLGSTLSNVSIAGAVVISNVTEVNLGGLAGNVDLGTTNTAGAGVALSVGYNNASTRYDGTLGGAGSLNKVGSGMLTLGTTNNYLGGTTVSAGTLIASALANGIGNAGSSIGTGSLTLNGGTMQFGTNALLRVTNTVSGLVTFNGGTLNGDDVVNLGTMRAIGGTSTLVGDLYNYGVLTNSGGTLRIGVAGIGMVTNSGTIALAGGTLTASIITNAGTVIGYGMLDADIANSSVVSATNGELKLDGYVTGVGSYRAEAGATLSFNGGGTISSLVNNGGTVRLASVVTNNAVFNSAGTMTMLGGIYQTTGRLTNGAAAWIIGNGTLNAGLGVVNVGTIVANQSTPLVVGQGLLNTASGVVSGYNGRLVVSGVFTNQGTLNFLNSIGTFNSSVVNQGAWISDPSTFTFAGNYTVTTNGYINAVNLDTYVFQANMLNQSTNNMLWSTLNMTPTTNAVHSPGTKFIFDGVSVTQTQQFYHPGLLLTGGFVGVPPSVTASQEVSTLTAVEGFVTNYALGSLWLTNTTLALAPTVPGGPTGALFVDDLFLFAGSKLIISNDMRVYFVNSNSWSMANITLLGNAEIHQLYPLAAELLVIPEPNVLLMWLCGGLTVVAARRRRRPSRN